MEFKACNDDINTISINVNKFGDFYTSYLGAKIKYDFGSFDNEFSLTIEEETLCLPDIEDLIKFLNFAKEHLK